LRPAAGYAHGQMAEWAVSAPGGLRHRAGVTIREPWTPAVKGSYLLGTKEGQLARMIMQPTGPRRKSNKRSSDQPPIQA